MREEALRQAKEAFATGKEDIFAAIEVIHDVLQYAIKESPIALAKDEIFRRGEPYILDIIEATGTKVPLKRYLTFALDNITYGNEFGVLAELIKNKYFANNYTGKDAYIAFLYLIGVVGIAQGQSLEDILEHIRTIIPDEVEEAYDEFVAKWERGISKEKAKKTGRVVCFEKDKK